MLCLPISAPGLRWKSGGGGRGGYMSKREFMRCWGLTHPNMSRAAGHDALYDTFRRVVCTPPDPPGHVGCTL